MLARPYRLRKSSDILRLYKQGQRAHTRWLVVYSRANHLGESRATVVVAKKVDKRATVRNRNRRRVGEWLRTSWSQIAPGFDILVSIKSDIRELTATELQAELVAGLRKLGVWK